jgi:uncharacterized membrane protein
VTHERGEGEHESRRVTALVRVILSGSVGVIVAGAAGTVAPWQISSLLAWDTAAAILCAWIWVVVRGADAATTQRIATREDDSRPAADLVLIAASIASLLGVGLALLKASGESGSARTITTTVAVVTVALSWLAVYTVFTLRYARLYYLGGGGIDFHSEQAPDYGDFRLRRIQARDDLSGLGYGPLVQTDPNDCHALLSYVFGIAVIATTINVVAGLLGR